MALSEQERRVLGHLPVYRTAAAHSKAEKHMRKVNVYPDDWKLPKSMNVEGLTARVAEDPFNDFTTDSQEEVKEVLLDLEADGLVKKTANDEWGMTAAGLEALQN